MLASSLRRLLAAVALALGASAAFDDLPLLLSLAAGVGMVAFTADPGRPDAASRYRLEHRRPGRVRVLAATDDEAAGRAALRAHTGRLEAAGVPGQLVLVEAATGLIATWHVLKPRPHGTSPRSGVGDATTARGERPAGGDR